MNNAELIADARTIAAHSAVSLPEHADCLTRLADALEASEALVKELKSEAKDHKAEQIFRINELQELGEAQARVKELEAGGWEYEVRNEVHRFRSVLTPDFEQANRWAQEDPHDFIVRRRKAGPWVPVESEGTDG